jgi:hypothetical protein
MTTTHTHDNAVHTRDGAHVLLARADGGVLPLASRSVTRERSCDG